MSFLLYVLACGAETPPPSYANVAPAEIREVLPCGERDVLLVREGALEFWVAIPPQPAEVGRYALLGKGPSTPSVRCGERALSDVLVIDTVRVVDLDEARAYGRLLPPEGGLSLAELMAQREALAGETVAVRGRVVKASLDVLGSNWYHLVDGSMEEGDLTITSEEQLEVGDLVVARGPLTIDKDLGFGYFYEAILEAPALEVE